MNPELDTEKELQSLINKIEILFRNTAEIKEIHISLTRNIQQNIFFKKTVTIEES